MSVRHHFFVDPSDVSDEVVELTRDEAHHAVHVLRIRPGEEISVADGTGRVADAVVTCVGDVVEAEIRGVRSVARIAPGVVLYQGVAKADHMDVAVQKAVEIGVERVVPVVCERTVVRWDERKQTKAVVRWQGIAEAAAKQCRAAWPTAVEDIRPSVDDAELETTTVAFDVDAPRRLRDVLPESRPACVGVFVGPEGGLSPAELKSLSGRGAALATLGPRILRTETAGPIAAALILYAYGSLG